MLLNYSSKLNFFFEIEFEARLVILVASKYFPETRFSGECVFRGRLGVCLSAYVERRIRANECSHIPYESEFDAIGAFDMLEHNEKNEVVLQKICEALKADEIIFITLPQHR